MRNKTRYFHAHETVRYDILSGLPLATFWRRALAMLIDLGIVALIGLPSFLRKHHPAAHEPGLDHMLLELIEEIRGLIESVFYFAITLKLGKGRTPGKWLMKIRVMSLTHDEIGWWQSTERALGYGASLLEGGFGFAQYFLNRNRMCVHDRIAETIVVDNRKPPIREEEGLAAIPAGDPRSSKPHMH